MNLPYSILGRPAVVIVKRESVPVAQGPQLEPDALWDIFEGRVAAVCHDELGLAQRLRPRLEPEHWMLEWHVPWWVGLAYGLDDNTCQQIVLGNLFGLAALRLEDDLADGEADLADEESTERASRCFYDLALATYRELMPDSSPFWRELEIRMDEWRAAATADRDPARLARRGAPLKLSAFAVCELTGRIDAYPSLDACLDHALAATVLFDHYRDWETDLAAGRWNAFVDRALSGLGPAASRTQVYAAMMTSDPIVPFFATIDDELRQAAIHADQAGVTSLAEHLRRFAADLAYDGLTARSHYRQLGERSMAVMFGSRQA